VIPLAKPIVLLDLSHSTPEAIEAYKGIYHGVGQVLGLKYDNACSDPSRAFYLPACAESNLDKCQVVSINTDYGYNEDLKVMEFVGEPVLLDFSDYPRKKIEEKKRSASKNGNSGTVADVTGATIDLKAWSREHADFDMESLLRDVLPDEDIREDRSGKEGFHIACPFEDGHTTAGGSGTYVVNGDPNETDSANAHWNIYCTHDSCKTRAGENSQRLIHLGRLVEDGIVSREHLYLYSASDDDDDDDDDGEGDFSDSAPFRETATLVSDAKCGAEMNPKTGHLTSSKLLTNMKGGASKVSKTVSSPFHYPGRGANGLAGDKANQVHMLNVECQLTKKWNKVLVSVGELGNPQELTTKLRKLGMTVAGTTLFHLLAVIRSPNSFVAVEATGWHELSNGQRVFVLPDHSVIAKTGSDASNLTVQPVFDADPRFAKGGTLSGSLELLEVIANEPDMVTAVLQTLVAPLVKDFGLTEPGFLHFWGPTTSGKTTALNLGASMCGIGSKAGPVEKYHGTAHSIEIKAARSLDMPFFLDELRDGKPEDCQRLSYALANGRTKSAGAGHGDKLRDEKVLRSATLSSGEMSMRAKVEGAGLSHDGGADIRVSDIRINAFKVIAHPRCVGLTRGVGVDAVARG
jgi:hypothetical protein